PVRQSVRSSQPAPGCTTIAVKFVIVRPLVARLLVGNAHETEGIGGMARPVVLWTKPNIARLVFAFMIPAQRINAASAFFGVEPDTRKQATACLDTLKRCALALVLDRLSAIEASPLDMVHESHRLHFDCGEPVKNQGK